MVATIRMELRQGPAGAPLTRRRGALKHGIGARFVLMRTNFPRSSMIFSESEGMPGAVCDELEYFGEVVYPEKQLLPDTVGGGGGDPEG